MTKEENEAISAETSDDYEEHDWPTTLDMANHDGESTAYPLTRAAILDATTFKEYKVVGVWDDDHEPCVALIATTDKDAEVYFSVWWCNAGYFYRCEGDDDALAEMVQDMKDEILGSDDSESVA